MLHTTLVNKLKKAGFETIVHEDKYSNGTARYSYSSISADKKHVLEWFTQEYKGKAEATCVKFRNINDHSDSMTDYFAGTFMDSAKEAVEWMLKIW